MPKTWYMRGWRGFAPKCVEVAGNFSNPVARVKLSDIDASDSLRRYRPLSLTLFRPPLGLAARWRKVAPKRSEILLLRAFFSYKITNRALFFHNSQTVANRKLNFTPDACKIFGKNLRGISHCNVVCKLGCLFIRLRAICEIQCVSQCEYYVYELILSILVACLRYAALKT